MTVGDLTGTLTIGDPPVPVTISAAGQKAVFTFSGTVGQQATVRITNNGIGGSTTVTLRRQNGATTSNSSSAARFNLATQTLQSGTYTVTVDPSGPNTGTLHLAVTSP